VRGESARLRALLRRLPLAVFLDALEADFQRRYREQSARFARVALLLGTLLYSGFYFWDLVVEATNARFLSARASRRAKRSCMSRIARQEFW
jgi:hypothetical protein